MTYQWEFLVFERHINAASNICVLQLDRTGQIDFVTNLTNDSYSNLNPSISYDFDFVFNGYVIKHSLAVWQTNRNGRWDIFGSYYNINSGWGTPFPIDTSVNNKFNPESIYLNNSNFALVYERDHDIIFKNLDAMTQTITYDTNLTINDTSICKNPFLVYYNSKFYVSYEREKFNRETSINIRTSQSLPNWSISDTTAYEGNNINSGFIATSGANPANVFSSDRRGNYNIYGTILNIKREQVSIIVHEARKIKTFKHSFTQLLQEKAVEE